MQKNPFHAPALSSEAQKTPASNTIPGLHIVANLEVKDFPKLVRFEPFREFILGEIRKNKLSNVGAVFHNFETGGFTAVICLTESHLSIHTWPESQYLTFDIFLSNYLRDNRQTTRKVYRKVKEFFNATVLFEKIIDR